ncbi:hypothetical protein L1049_003287 [Liquidambar formosana]|uniref:Uncharacterized protein n=1 Tax=Liquidambar formosana TaxID=63359 RepID=A0AAP0R9G0_LIQFO
MRCQFFVACSTRTNWYYSQSISLLPTQKQTFYKAERDQHTSDHHSARSHPAFNPKMKREGRQHGLVRTNRILPSPFNARSESRFVNKFDSPPTAGLFTKVQSKPTNHSKFTGKCNRPRCTGCHVHPACKSKDKAKGTQKLRSCDVVANYKLITWRVVDGRPGLNFDGVSATGILDYMGCHDYLDNDDVDEDDEEEVDNCVGDLYKGSYGFADDGPIVESNCYDEKKEIELPGVDEIKDDEEDDGDMGFCEVGFVCEQVDGDEGWCLVGEM